MEAHTIARHAVRLLRDNNFMLTYKRLLTDNKFRTYVSANKRIIAKANGNLVTFMDECMRTYGMDTIDFLGYPFNTTALPDADYYKLYDIRIALLKVVHTLIKQ